jgi:uncharacterized peroxidase-related enzyme
MSYLSTPVEAEARDDVVRMYDADRARLGHVANYTKVFALRPEVYDAWAQLNSAIKAGMDLRRYELATVAAARRLCCSYCALAHGTVLRDKFHDAATVQKIAEDHRNAGLDPTDVAVIDFAAKAARDAAAITATDVDTLRQHGLSDVDIFQVVLAVAARCFFSTALDAVGAEPDSHYRASVEPDLQRVLTVGRPIARDGEGGAMGEEGHQR